jgi:hypothetical protein
MAGFEATLGGRFCPTDDNNGKWYTHIKVLLSRGSGYKTYPLALWKRMRKLLQLERLGEVQALLECPMSSDEYESILKKKGHI